MFSVFNRTSKLIKATRQVRTVGLVRRAEFQQLEARTLMSASHHHHHHHAAPKRIPAGPAVPLTVTTMGTTGGTELRITGTAGNDVINLKQSGNTLTLTTGTGWTQTFTGTYADVRIDGGSGDDVVTIDKSVNANLVILGGAGNDVITDNGSGTDSIYGGSGVNKLTAGLGSDTLVSIGGSADTLTGGSGLDSFWTNSNDVVTNVTAAEKNAGALHAVSSFMDLHVNGVTQTVTKDLLGQTYTEPTLGAYATGYTDFSTKPLFSAAGPSENDIQQGGVGDCYFLSVLSSEAKLNPQLIRQSIVSLGDGTFAVQFAGGNGVKQYLRLDGKLPTTSWGGLAYANTGAQSSTWVALLEKAWTYFRSNAGSYKSIEAGYMGETYNALSLANHSIYSAANATALLTQLNAELAAGHSVTYATNSDMANLIGGHAYTVDHVAVDAKGNPTGLVLRNPWGVDGAGYDGKDDGYVTVTPTVAFQDFSFATVGNSAWPLTVMTKAALKANRANTPLRIQEDSRPANFVVKPVR